MKRILCGLIAAVMVVGLVGCQSGRNADNPEGVKETQSLLEETKPQDKDNNDISNNEIEGWNEADFSFYDENGKEKAFTTTNEHNIALSAYEALKTNRGVEIGDRAETALNLYEIPIELSVYGSGQDFYSYSKDSDFEQLIIEYAAEDKELDIMIAFDEDFKPIDSYEMIQNEQPISNVWLFGIIIIDEKIADIMISHW